MTSKEGIQKIDTGNLILKKKPTIWERLLRLSLLVSAFSGFFRAYGAITQWNDLAASGLKAWQLWYLAIAGMLVGLLNLAAWILLKRSLLRRVYLAWASVAVTVGLYWSERIFLWAPDQRGGNFLFMIGWHFLWVGLLVIFAAVERKMEKRFYGPGN